MGVKKSSRIPTPKKAAFLAAYAATCTVTKAASAANINRASHYDWLQSDPDYKAKFAQVQEQVAQALEDEAIRRAYHGTQRPVTVAGKRELVTEFSDTLLIFLLKGARPQKYRDNIRQELTGINGGPLVPPRVEVVFVPTPKPPDAVMKRIDAEPLPVLAEPAPMPSAWAAAPMPTPAPMPASLLAPSVVMERPVERRPPPSLRGVWH